MKNFKIAFLFLGVVLLMSACQKQDVADDQFPGTSMLKASYTLTNWMGSLNSSSKLSQFSIPGSHDAGARYEPVSGTAICQTLTIGDQLNAGVRFLDVRCRHYQNAFAIHHGSIYQNLNFDDVLNACISFLNSNPTECIIISVKEEYDASGNTRTFEQTFDTYTAKNPGYWYLGDAVPALSSVRGKIVLLRRFSATATPKGIDATNWADNTTFSINNSGSQLRIQDNYVVSDNNTKWTAITNLFTEAKTGSSDVLYLNFTSGYKPLIFSIPSIPSVSNTINPKVVSYFTSNTTGRVGVIASDFSDSNKSSLIIRTNF